MRQQAQFHVLRPRPGGAPRRGAIQEHVSLIGCTADGFLRLGCLGELGHQVIGVSDAASGTFDLDAWAIAGEEPYLGTMLEDAADCGLIKLGFDLDVSVAVTDATLVCVEVPLAADGSSDFSRLEPVVESLGRAIAKKGSYHTVVICAPVPPGTCMGMIAPRLEQASGGVLGSDFGIAVWPLTTTRGQAVSEFFGQERVVFGASDRRAAQQMYALLGELDCELLRSDILAAEFRYFTMKAWGALRNRFREDITQLSAAMGIAESVDLLTDGEGPQGAAPDLSASAVPMELLVRGAEGAPREDAVGALGHFARSLHVDTPTIFSLSGGEVVPWPMPAHGGWFSHN